MNTLNICILFSIITKIELFNIFDIVDQDNFLNAVDLIERRGFRAETHSVTTSDGYILTVFRIINPFLNRTNQRPVVLWHGITEHSDTWLSSVVGRLGKDGVYAENDNQINDCDLTVTSSLAYTLSACGYDVWLPNTRGTDYSQKHLTMDANTNMTYWEYTFTEVGLFDVRAVVEHVLSITKRDSVGYIGFSMGSTSMFVLQCLQPEFERYVKPFIALAPFVYMSNMRSALRFVASFEPLLRSYPLPLGIPMYFAQAIGVMLCGNQYFNEFCMNSFINSVTGFDTQNFNKTRLPIYISHTFRPYSSWVFSHIGQLIRNRRFTMFDYGTKKNLERYGQSHAPDYPLSKIRSENIAIFYGFSDLIANVTDVTTLINNLQVPLLESHLMPVLEWDHLDFQWGLNQGIYLNRKLLRILKMFN